MELISFYSLSYLVLFVQCLILLPRLKLSRSKFLLFLCLIIVAQTTSFAGCLFPPNGVDFLITLLVSPIVGKNVIFLFYFFNYVIFRRFCLNFSSISLKFLFITLISEKTILIFEFSTL